ncbi:MAG: YmdB family metallophosphoesterase [Spirochaetales bacterium]|nr:YmdB family metallophosphoesterase [Spirochaetales bacterium]
MRILYIGEIVGRVGIFSVKKLLPQLKRQYEADLVIACANGATGGAGIGKAHSVYLHKLGIDVLTTGEAAFYKKDIVEAFPKTSWLLRPINYPPGVPGRGFRACQTSKGAVVVVQLLGQAGFQRVHLDNPFQVIDAALPRLKELSAAVILDFRAPTTAERRAMIRHVDGRVSAVLGSYGRALTADASISVAGTASITDTGRTGSLMSVGGMDADTRIGEYLSGVPVWAKDAVATPELQACVLELDTDGRAQSIETLRVPCEEEFNEGTRNSD